MHAYEDPDTARDLGLSVIEAEIERLPQPLGHFRDRAADIAAKLYERACQSPRETTTCESQVHPRKGGPGGNPPSLARAPRSTKWTPTPGSTPSESSATATGPGGLSSRPASGGNPTSTPKPANSRRPKNAEPKSTASSSTPGVHGRG